MENADLILRLNKLREKVGSIDRPLIDLVITRLTDAQQINALLHQNNFDLHQENMRLENIAAAAKRCRPYMEGDLHGGFMDLEEAIDAHFGGR